jgi:transcriptional/translational regulatory protein YebC/TACO1
MTKGANEAFATFKQTGEQSFAVNSASLKVLAETERSAQAAAKIPGFMDSFQIGGAMVKDQGGGFEVITDPSQLVEARTALQSAGIDYDSAEAEFVPSLTIDVDAETARKVFRLIDALEDSDDVQNIYSNFAVSSEVQAELDED